MNSKTLGLRVTTNLHAGSTNDITQKYKDCFDGCYEKVIDGTDTYDGCMSKCLGESSTDGTTSISNIMGIVL